MPPRRSHKKSRAGCRTCKIRKIKCDEVHPRCGNCLKHGVACDFGNVEPSEQSATSTPTSSNLVASPSLLSISQTSPSQTSDNGFPSPLPTPLGGQSTNIGSPPPFVWPPPTHTEASMSPLPSLRSILKQQPLPPPLPPPHQQQQQQPHHQASPLLPPPPPPPPPPPSLPPLQSHTPPAFNVSPTNRFMELRLLHQFTTSTCYTLMEYSPAAEETWQEVVPKLAFAAGASDKHQTYLTDAMLSVAALHLRSMNPNDKAVVRASHAYMASSLAEYRAALNSGIDETNAEALFLTATLISFQSTASRIFLRDDTALDEDGDVDMFHPDQEYADEVQVESSNRKRSTYTLPLSWFHSFQGVKTIVATSWTKIRHSSAVKAVIDSQPVLQLEFDASHASGGGGGGSDVSFFGHLLDGIDDEIAVEEDDDMLAAATRQSYLHAIAVLNWAHKLPHRGAALAFPATVTKRFVDLVEVRRPRALAILAAFFALLKRFDKAWWLHDASRREVMGIVSLFERGSPWWRHLEWPVRIALHDGEGSSIPDDVWGADCAAEESRMMQAAVKGELPPSVVNHIEMFTQMLASASQANPFQQQQQQHHSGLHRDGHGLNGGAVSSSAATASPITTIATTTTTAASTMASISNITSSNPPKSPTIGAGIFSPMEL